MQYIAIDIVGDWHIIREEIEIASMLHNLEHVIMPYQGEKVNISEYILERSIFLRPKKDGQQLAVYSVRRRNQ